MGNINVNRELCVGSGWCVLTAPEVFTLDEEGKSRATQVADSQLETARDAAGLCPVEAIEVTAGQELSRGDQQGE